ncbi:MAG: ATP-binding protein [Chitinophagaceae bacterium]
MKYLLTILIMTLFIPCTAAQGLPASVLKDYGRATTDSARGRVLLRYLDQLPRDSMYLTRLGLVFDYFRQQKDEVGQDYLEVQVSRQLAKTGDFINSRVKSLAALSRFTDRGDEYGIMMANVATAVALSFARDWGQSAIYYRKIINQGERLGDKVAIANAYNGMASDMELGGKIDSAIVYARIALNYAEASGDLTARIYSGGTLGECYTDLKQYDLAIPLLRVSLALSRQVDDQFAVSWSLADFSRIYLELNQHDSARYYGHLAIKSCVAIGYTDILVWVYDYMYQSFEKTGPADSVNYYLRLYVDSKESLFNTGKTIEMQEISNQEHLRQHELQKQEEQYRSRIKTYVFVAIFLLITIIGLILYRNNRQKQKANNILQETVKELKATQAQLIHSEKMASLGELTAGIAHEIQNPLNFVNNFSEINTELIDEMKLEIDKGRMEEVKALANDIKENEQKISHHGKRADAIVKGMLQHSRSSTGKKEPTDLNKLADEYLRLAYHGLRAKDKSFNATMKADFDNSLPLINVIPQDLGRVVLNLITNAFYAVTEKSSRAGAAASGTIFQDGEMDRKTGDFPGEKYEPTVTVSTKNLGNKVEIRVSDNGNGIPEGVMDKIFQPFFTTKPTGQGTGLGLSMSYDIITKGHGGELNAETTINKGTTFIITLPI